MFAGSLILFESTPVEAKTSTKKAITCSTIKTCTDAYDYLKKWYKDLDRDHDGIPCENLCKAPKKKK